ncbi:MAG: hypothetical protein Q4F25_04530 [Eubacteriales bacterium]|nr:hypothetical protein [Eubacteriales bacterium]
MRRLTAVIMMCILVCALVSCSQSGSNTPQTGQKESQKDPAGKEEAVPADTGTTAVKENETAKGEDMVDLSYEEVMRFVEGSLGEGFEECTGEADGIRDDVFYSVCLRIKPEAEDKVTELLHNLAGNGIDAGKRKLPAMQDRICDKLRGMEPVRIYDYMRQGENGAKTRTTEIYTARAEDGLYLFIFE